MKTQDQKHNEKFPKRAARWWCIFSQRISQWWDNVVEWAEDIDLGEILTNLFLVLLIGGGFFGFIYLGVHNSHKDKTDSITDTVVEEQVTIIKKQDKIDWDIDTVHYLAPSKKGYKLYFKGKAPYYIMIANLDSIQ